MCLEKESTVRLITHSGTFHHDEVLSTAIFKKLYPNNMLIRTREQDIIETGTIVYDVGGIFDPSKHRYDHHQREFKETYSPKHSTKLSSAGLAYKYFGDRLIRAYGIEIEESIRKELMEKIYEDFFEYVDLIDNYGPSQFGHIIPRTISSLVRNFNNIDYYGDSADEYKFREMEMIQFNKALEIVTIDMDNYYENFKNFYLPGYVLGNSLVKNHNPDEKILIINDKSINTTTMLGFALKYRKDIHFLIFNNSTSNETRISPLSVDKINKKYRSGFPTEWMGLRNEELQKLSGVESAIFIHSNGFLGITKGLSGAIDLCKKSLELNESRKNQTSTV